jgi:hypothetical protein
LTADDRIVGIAVELDPARAVRFYRVFKPGIDDMVCKYICQYRADYTSNNVAKLPLEFSSLIEREGLKVSYGEGFGGAPLRLLPAGHGVTTGAGERRDEQATEQDGKTFGGDDHV